MDLKLNPKRDEPPRVLQISRICYTSAMRIGGGFSPRARAVESRATAVRVCMSMFT